MSSSSATTDKNTEGVTAPSPFFHDYQLLWTPQCPERTAEELKADELAIQSFAARCRQTQDRPTRGATSPVSPAASPSLDMSPEANFTFEDRVLTRCLLYCVIGDPTLRALLDGFLLPPPFACGDMSSRVWTPRDVGDLAHVLAPQLRLAVALMPFNMALQCGSYDARLRAAAYRLCWIFNLPDSVIQQQEQAVAELHAAMLSDDGAGGAQGGTDSRADKKKDIEGRKQGTKVSLKRVATIGGFAVLGGGALILTGGLAAPLIAPAYGALVSATAATLGAIGTVGGALLGGGALAAVFAGAIGVATHAAALAGILTPVLTAANVTAIFGVTGVALGGYKALRRTDETDLLTIRAIDEVESFEQPSAALDAAEVVQSLANSSQAVVQSRMGDLSVLNALSALPDVVEEGSETGVVVPSHTRSVAMSHARAIKVVSKRRRSVVFALDNQLAGFCLRLKATSVVSGVWALTPPQSIPEGTSGVCACVNRWARPTGAGFILCYEATPTKTVAVSTRSGFRLWLRVFVDTLNAWELTSFVENLDTSLDPFAAEYYLEETCSGKSYTRTQRQVVMEMHRSPFTYLRVYLASDVAKRNSRPVTFPLEELPQRELEYMHDVKERRKIGVSVLNRTGQHTVHVVDLKLVNGTQWPQTASPMCVNPGEASLTAFTNSSWSLEGAEGYYVFELVNGHAEARHPRYYLRFQFEVSATKSLNYAVAVATTLIKLKQMELTPFAPESNVLRVDLPPGLFFSATVRVDSALSMMELQLRTDVERAVGEQAQCASLSVGVCGFSAVFDPRRPSQDQQVGLWQPVLRHSQLLGRTEAYALQWEDTYLTRFGEAIHVDLELADQMTSRVTGTVKKTVKKQLMRGALFAGMNAYKSLLGAFQLPLYAVWAADVIDNTFAVLSNRAVYAGKDLAVALLDETRGRRPVSLVGFSFGAKVIAECLCELERVDALSVVENVYLLGGTFPADTELWQRLRRVVAGRLVNVYTRHDWALWMMYKANDVNVRPMAGITAVNVPGVENVDMTPLVLQHSEYASRLADVLDAIPSRPTQETWNPKNRLGSPGVLVPTRKVDATVANIGASLGSLLSSTPYCGFAVRNHVLSDLDDFEPTLQLCGSLALHCFYDFTPRDGIPVGTGGCFGVVGNTNDSGIGGVVSYRLSMPAWCDRILVVVLYFYAEKNDEVLVAVQPNLVTARVCADESQEAVDERVTTIVAQTVTSLEDVRRVCERNGSKDGSVNTEIALVASPFADQHRSATVHLSWRKCKGGVVLTVVGLFLTDASEPQQGRVTEASFNKEYLSTLEARCPTESDAADTDGTPPGASSLMAPVLPMEDLHAKLRATVKQFASQPKSHSARVAASGAAGGSLVPVPIAIVNCGEVPVFFATDVYYRSLFATAATPADDSAAAPGTDVEWLQFPPPEIPPRSVTVMVISSLDNGEVFPDVRYRTAKAECGFAIASPLPSTSDSTATAPARTVSCAPDLDCTLPAEASGTSMLVDGMTCFIAIMTPVGHADSGKDHNLASAGIKDALRDHGWVIF